MHAVTSQRKVTERSSDRAFLIVCALLFVASSAVTIVWCASMSAMEGMPMPGGWTMSMTWMRMPGQTWSEVAASFLGMWIAMMVAMMLPSLVPILWRYRRTIRAAGVARVGRQTVLVGSGYFLVWTLLGAAVFPVGRMLATAAMQLPVLARAVPFAIGVAVVIAGVLQFSRWKARHLACCQGVVTPKPALPAKPIAAWQFGVQLGFHCVCCCVGPTMVLLMVGVMDLRAMTIVAAAITIERIAPAVRSVPQAIGAILIAMGVAGLILLVA